MRSLCLVTVLALTWGWSVAYFSDSDDRYHGHLTPLGEIVSDGVRFLISPFKAFGHDFMPHLFGHHHYRPYPAPAPPPHYRPQRVSGVEVDAYAEAKKTVQS